MKSLKDTVEGMLSTNWKERLVAEIEQCDIRIYNLSRHLEKIGEDSPEYSLLTAQLEHQTAYLNDLMARANTFDIDFELPSAEEARKKFNSILDGKDQESFEGFTDPLFWAIVFYMMATDKD